MSSQSNCNICISQNNTNSHFFSNILEPLNYHYLDGTEKKPKKSTLSICHKSEEGKFSQNCCLVSELNSKLPEYNGLTNYYITTNQFTFNRKAEHVNGLLMLTCDLDTYKTEKYSKTTHKKLIDDVGSICAAALLPLPTIIMYSGNGYYLKWIFSQKIKVSWKTQLSAAQRRNYDERVITTIDRWRIAQRVINKIFIDFGADMKATDVSRVLRMAGTINSKTGKLAEVLEFGKTVPFQGILDALEPHTHEEDISAIVPAIKAKRVKKEKISKIESPEYIRVEKTKSDKPSSKHLVKKTLGTLQQAREADLWKLIELRGGTAQEGYRMHYLLYILGFRAGIGRINTDTFNKEALRLGVKIFGDYSFDLDALSTLAKKVENYNTRYKINPTETTQTSPIYTPTNEKLISIFDITEDEQKHLSTIIGRKEIKARDKERKRLQRRALGMQEHSQSHQQIKPWLLLGIGRTKWYELGKPVKL